MKSLARSLLAVTLLSVMTISLEIPLDKDYEESSGEKVVQLNSEEDVTDSEEYEYEDYDDEYDDYYEEDYEDEDELEYRDDEKDE